MRRIVLLALLAFALFTAINVIEIAQSDEAFDFATIALDLVDTALMIGAIGVVAFIAIEGRDLARERASLADHLEKAKAEGDLWRQRAQAYLQGLGDAINAQFQEWRLTSSEAEIAMLLLKGLSHREIAGLRATSEATVRQQSRAIYQKSGLGSRAELAAYFLEDLTAPATQKGGVVTPISFTQDRR